MHIRKIICLFYLLTGSFATTIEAQQQSLNTNTALTSPVPADRLFPKVQTPATSLVVADLATDSIDGQIAACGLQGIVNRTSKQKIYVLNTRCKDNHGGWNNAPGAGIQAQMGRVWLKEVFASLPTTEVKAEAGTNGAFLALLRQYAGYVKGLIIYDPMLEEATIEAATTIAGQKDGIIVSPALAKQVASWKFPVIEDLQGKFSSNIQCLDWLKDNYFASANKQVAFTWSHMHLDRESTWGAANKDYVVANRLFTFFLDIQDKKEAAYYETIIKAYPYGTPVMGWTDELKADRLFAEYGYYMVPMISVENFSVMSSFPSVKGTQTPPKALPADTNDVFVACFVSDGDNLLHSMIYEPYTILNSSNYGSVPATWIINPIIAELAPPVFQWYQQRTGSQELGAMLADGSPISERFTGFSVYCNMARHYLDVSGIYTMKQMIEAETVGLRVQPYCMNGGYAGTDWRGIGPYEYHLDNATFHIGTTNAKDSEILRVLDAAPPGKPLFLSVFFGGAHRDLPTAIKELQAKLQSRNDGKHYHFVRSMDLAATYKKWIGSK